MTIENKKLIIIEKLRRKVDMVCRFAGVKYEVINGCIIMIIYTN